MFFSIFSAEIRKYFVNEARFVLGAQNEQGFLYFTGKNSLVCEIFRVSWKKRTHKL